MKFLWFVCVLMSCRSYYEGPVSNHFDGTYFTNRTEHSVSLWDLLALSFGGPNKDWPDFIDDTSLNAHFDKVEGRPQVTFINHASFLVQTSNLNILTDPIYSEYASPVQFAGPRRIRKPGVNFEDLPEIDIVLISHDHYDHLDAETIEALEAHNMGEPPLYVAGLGVGSHLRSLGVQRYKELDWDQSFSFQDLDIWFVECQHRSGRGIFDHKKSLWGSFVIQSSEGRFYVAGDTAYSPHFAEHGKRYGPFDLALLPIGAYEPRWFMNRVHVNPEQAVQAHFDLKSQMSLGMHFGTFKLTYEGVYDPPETIERIKNEQDFQNFIVPKFGESFSIPRSRLKRLERDFLFDDPKRWLSSTNIIDVNHSSIQAQAAYLTRGFTTDIEKAIQLHDFVRDRIEFGWSDRFALEKASNTLKEKKGFCMTKTSLFIALLRAAGIPARPVFVDISSKVLRGVLDRQGFLDHSYTEVFLNRKWVRLDSYVIPKKQALALKAKLAQEQQDYGYGVAVEGQSTWDGRHDQFIQYVNNSDVKGKEYPFYQDAEDFYTYAKDSNHSGFFERLTYSWVFDGLNQKYRSLF